MLRIATLGEPPKAELLDRIQAIGDANERAAQLLEYYFPSVIPIKGFVDLNGVVAETARMLAEEDLTILLDLDVNLPPVRANALAVHRVLLNIAKNARDAVLGRDVCEICFSTEMAGECACVIVRDSGPGMSPEVRDNLFQPGLSTKGPGHGYGMAIAATEVGEMDGRIEVESAPGDGTRIRVFMPV